VLLSTVLLLTFYLFPFVAIFLTSGSTRWLYIGALVVLLGQVGDSIRFLGLPRWYAVGFPLATLLFLYILWKATLKTLLSGGIEWRGTRYSLKELRSNKI
jgi:hypothetical protein